MLLLIFCLLTSSHSYAIQDTVFYFVSRVHFIGHFFYCRLTLKCTYYARCLYTLGLHVVDCLRVFHYEFVCRSQFLPLLLLLGHVVIVFTSIKWRVTSRKTSQPKKKKRRETPIMVEPQFGSLGACIEYTDVQRSMLVTSVLCFYYCFALIWMAGRHVRSFVCGDSVVDAGRSMSTAIYCCVCVKRSTGPHSTLSFVHFHIWLIEQIVSRRVITARFRRRLEHNNRKNGYLFIGSGAD